MPETLLIMLGIILIMLGLFLLVFWVITRSVQEGAGINNKENANVKASGVIMIGPVPIVFGSDKRSALIAIILAIVLMLLVIIFLK
ncbi:MAG: TIGR00304 family protein [Methanobacteriota archaeon]